MRSYLVGILRCGESFTQYAMFDSNEHEPLKVLRDFYVKEECGYDSLDQYEEEEGEELDLDYIEDIYFKGEDLVDLLFDINNKDMLVENGEIYD